jgi:hypothetical protein
VATGAVIAILLSLNVLHSSPLDDYQGLTMLTALILGPLTFFAANLVASRERRAGSIDTLAGTPITLRSRTAAVLLAVLGPTALTVVLIAATFVTYRALGAHPPRWPTVPELAVPPATVLGAGLIGVMTARWLPVPGGAAVVMIGLVLWVQFSSYQMLHETAMSLAPFRELDINDGHGHVTGYFKGSLSWHIAYILCLDVMAAIGALLATPGRRAPLLAVGAAVVGAAVLTGWVQLA